MSVKKFKFISPGVFVKEIDNSQLPGAPGDVGPAIIGRALKGPGLRPVTVSSFEEFVNIFGDPIAGGTNGDISRNGNTVGPTYGAYAAQAWLKNNSPLTFVRLVGQEHTNADSSTGRAGWVTNNVDPDPDATAGGAYGLFVYESGSASTQASLAAVWYVQTGSVALSGNVFTSSAGVLTQVGAGDAYNGQVSSTNKWFQASANTTWKAIVSQPGASNVETEFNFSESSENFIRKVFNTNPIVANSDTTVNDQTVESFRQYFLGETFEDEIGNLFTGSDATNQYAAVVPLFLNDASGDISYANHERDFSDPKTGYVFSQDLTTDSGSYNPTNQQKLFRFVAKNTGAWAAKNLKISIADISASPNDFDDYGTFSVLVRDANDTDSRPRILEQFNNCTLNPKSSNYISKKIGDKFQTWSDSDRRYRTYGDYDGGSNYIYVDMVSMVNEGNTDPRYLPYGFFGPPRFATTGSTSPISGIKSLLTGGLDFYNGTPDIGDDIVISGSNSAINLHFPSLRLRVSASEGNPTDPKDAFFGVDTTFNRQARPSRTLGGYTKIKPRGVDLYVPQSDPETVYDFIFTLDDMMNTAAAKTGANVYISGSRADTTVRPADLTYINNTSYKQTLDAGADRFTMLLHGGGDGLNVFEAEPFRNSQWSTSTTETNNAPFNSVQVAIDSLRDPEVVEYDLLAYPGCTNNVINRNMIDMAEDRGDALAVVDLQGGYVPETESTQSVSNRVGSVTDTINNKKNDLQINSSFGCAYYPWVQIQDTINGATIWAPPSVPAIGAMSFGQATQALWFSPAGFTRGGLSRGTAGLPVVGVRERLVSKDRDKLYEANINPIAQFPAEGIVIFGQKTLQVTPSALDRINVRRLLIFVKRQISKIAATLLFDQNVQTTWNRFRSTAGSFLAGVEAGLGLTDYRLILDESTTTPDLVDRNIMYAKIYLKPARAIEFIAIDFVITDSGASFED